MHMSDALLSPIVGTAMIAASAAAIAYSISKIKKDDLYENKIPLMAVSGAFVFAAQMINFTIPATGSSGHIGGGMLLAAILGGLPALPTLAAVLIIQALFFADGGLLALGCNILNMGVIPCLIVYPLIFKPLTKKLNYKNITAASIISCTVSLLLGAFSVVTQTFLSGVTELPFASFALMMLPIHLAIGLAEGIITASVLCFVYKTRPEIFDVLTGNRPESNPSLKRIVIIFAVATLLAGGLLSMYASSNPDGLEWSMEKVAGTTELESTGDIHKSAAAIQEKTAFMPDYDYKSGAETGSTATGTTTAGVIGGALTFLLAGAAGFVISRSKNKNSAIRTDN